MQAHLYYAKWYSHLYHASRRSRPLCHNTIPQHRQRCQAEDLSSHRHWGHEAQEDAGPATKLPVLEACTQEDAGQGEQGAQVRQAEVEEQEGAWLGATAGVPHQHQPQQEVTSDPDHERHQADHGEDHGEGDGGVGGDHVEKEVDYGRHGAGAALGKEQNRWDGARFKDRDKMVSKCLKKKKKNHTGAMRREVPDEGNRRWYRGREERKKLRESRNETRQEPHRDDEKANEQ